jgi:hypothetical protein
MRLNAPAILAALVAAIALFDFAGAWAVGLHIAHIMTPLLEIGATWVIFSLYLRWRPNPRLSEILTYVVLWLLFSTAAAVFTYVAAAAQFPLQDAPFRAMDAALGFDAIAWTHFLERHGRIFALLQLDYFSLIAQTSITVIWLAHTRTSGRNAQFLGAAILGLLLSTALATLLPALGPDPNSSPTVFGQKVLNDLVAMRAGQPVFRTMENLQGVIQFPSYHTFLAILIVWTHRGLATFWPAVLINGCMLLAIPAVGNHYLMDLFGGGAAACLAIAATAALLPARRAALPLAGAPGGLGEQFN